MSKNAPSQKLVTTLMCSAYDLDTVASKKLAKLMLKECSLLMAISFICIHLTDLNDDDDQVKEMWNKIKKNNFKLYKKLRYRITFASITGIPNKFGKSVAMFFFNFVHKRVLQFN